MVSSMIGIGNRDIAFSEARRFLEALGGQDQKFVFQWFADPTGIRNSAAKRGGLRATGKVVARA